VRLDATGTATASRHNCRGECIRTQPSGNARTAEARQGTSCPDEECQGKWDPDEAYDGAPLMGNRAVTVVASRRDCQGTVHYSEDYQTRSWLQAL